MDGLSIRRQLGIALTEAHRILKKRIDILGMDACFMSMGEVRYQIRDHVNIVVGAEGMAAGIRLALQSNPRRSRQAGRRRPFRGTARAGDHYRQAVR